MGFMDKVKTTLAGNADKAGKAIDKAAGLADTRTKGKHSDKISGAAAKARNYMDKLDDKGPVAKGPSDHDLGTDGLKPDDGGPATRDRGDQGPGLL